MKNKKKKRVNIYIIVLDKNIDIFLLESSIFKYTNQLFNFTSYRNIFYNESLSYEYFEKLRLFFYENRDYDKKISFIISPLIHKNITLFIKNYQKAGIFYLYDVCIDLIKSNLFAINILKPIFINVPKDILLSIEAYVKTDLSLYGAGKLMFMHRNSINYRLNKFIKLTNIDIRDYMNVMFVYLVISYLNS